MRWRRLVCRYLGHRPRQIKVLQIDVDIETEEQLARGTTRYDCAWCRSELMCWGLV